MPLSYRDKLKIFHDNFVKYAFNYIERQKAMALGQEVSVMTTPFKEVVGDFRIVPIIGFFTELGLKVSDLWSGRLYSSSANIKNLFPISEITIKQMLSTAIQEIAVHVEEHLNQLQDEQKIGAFATDAVLKLITCLKNRGSEKPELNYKDIVNAILKQNSFFTNDHFFSQLTGDIVTNNIIIDTDISSLRLDRHEEIIRRVEAKWDEEHASWQQQKSVGFYNVRDAVHNFVGRRDFLEQIHDCFTQGKTVIEIIGGLGGMGKTQAALQYIKEHKAEYSYRVRWLDSESKASLDASFREFAQKLKLSIEKKNDDEIRKLVIEKLEADIEQTLLVFDNVEDRILVSQYLPNLGGAKRHHVLITTRNTKDYDQHATRSGEDVIPLTPFNEIETIQYIKTILPEAIDEDALELANLFDNIPLGLSQSVAYIENNVYSIRQYIAEYQIEKKQGLAESLHDAKFEEEAGHVANIYTTLSMSLRALSSMPKAIELLRLCSYLHADAIPEYLFNSLFDSQKEKKDTIAALKGYSLVSVKIEEDIKFIYVHRIVQEVTRVDMGDEALQYLHQAINLVAKEVIYFPEVGVAVKWIDIILKNTPLLQHGISLIKHYDDVWKIMDVNDSLGIGISKLRVANGHLYIAIPEYNNAKREFFAALEIQENMHEKDHLLLARTYHGIGDIYQALGMNRESLPFLRKSLEIRKTLYGESFEVADSIHSIGNVYQAIGLYQKALDSYEESLQLKKTIYGNQHPSVALTIHAIGQSYRSLEDYEMALSKYEEALSILSIEGKKNEILPVVIHAIANIYLALERPYEALDKYEKSLEMKKKAYGHDHYSVAVTINGIGNVYKNLGKYQEALFKYEESLEMKIKAYGHDHPRVALTINAIGSVYMAMGMLNEALVKYEESLQIVRISYKGLLHPEIARDLQAIGDVYKILGKKQEALEKYQEVLQMQKDMYGKQHKNIDITIQKINIVHEEMFKGEFNHHLFITTFTIKEAIESAPTIKYFLSEILHIPLPELPKIFSSNYLWIGLHYTVCNIGIFLVLNKPDFNSALTPSVNYANKLLAYEYLSKYKQDKFQNTEDKTIDSLTKFFDKCGSDILLQTTLTIMNNINNGIPPIPIIYDIAIGSTVGGIQCYQQYNHNFYYNENASTIQIITDIAVGISTGYILFYNNPLDFSNTLGQMIFVKQSFMIISSVVMADYITKLSIATFSEFDYHNLSNIPNEIFHYLVGENQNYYES